MFGLGTRSDERFCFVIIEIGSGSVGVAIMVSEPGKPKPTYVWSHREYALIKDVIDATVPLKEVTTCLINAFLKLGNEGMRTLQSYDSSLSIRELQVTITAPWSYTITKNVTYADESVFLVTDRLLQDLLHAAAKEALESAANSQVLDQHELTIINTNIAGVIANGYTIPKPRGMSTKEIEVINTIGMTTKKLVTVISDARSKIIPGVNQHLYSFMYVFYMVLQNMNPNTNEACLIDITSEATEIGIIRDGVLTHVTSMPIGIYTLARSIAAATNLPKEEAFLFMNEGVAFVENKLSEAKRADMHNVVTAYETALSELFRKTGDALAIPKTLFVHTDAHTEAFFIERVEAAAKRATNSRHNAHPVTSKLLEDTVVDDTAIMLSAQFAHTRLQGDVL